MGIPGESDEVNGLFGALGESYHALCNISFIIMHCAEVLSGLLTRAQEEQAPHGIWVARSAPETSHLLLADYNIIFFRANSQEADKLKHILLQYQQASG